MKSLSALIGGILFGLGLAVSGMADPQIVLAFLTLDSGWNPALIGVMGAGVVTTFIGYRLILRRQQPHTGSQPPTIADQRCDVAKLDAGLGEV